MNFPASEKTFYFDHTTAFGNRYEGHFTVKCLLSIGEIHAMELEKTRLLGNYSMPTDQLLGIAVILSNLRAKVVGTDAPEWWKQSRGGASIREEEVLVALHSKVEETETQWRDDLMKSAQKPEENDQASES